MELLEILDLLEKKEEFLETVLQKHGEQKVEHVTIFFESILEECFPKNDDYQTPANLANDFENQMDIIDENIYDELVKAYFTEDQRQDLKDL